MGIIEDLKRGKKIMGKVEVMSSEGKVLHSKEFDNIKNNISDEIEKFNKKFCKEKGWPPFKCDRGTK